MTVLSILAQVKAALPNAIVAILGRGSKPTRARRASNRWLRSHCRDIEGRVLSIGSGDDRDGEGSFYRSYFSRASSYQTSEVSGGTSCDLVIDVRSMPEIPDESYDAIFCSGVLEHTDDFQGGLREITRIVRRGGILLLGLPFRQPIHMAPQDFWRFTEHGIRHLLATSFEVLELAAIDPHWRREFPTAYWVKARRLR
jgi:SAM-dependent methyltransferase